MRKKLVAAMAAALIMSLTAGCAPGDISRFASRAQRAGENIFEGSSVMAEAVPAAKAAGETAEETASSGDAKNAAGAGEQTADAVMNNTMAEETGGQETVDTDETESSGSFGTQQTEPQTADGGDGSIPAQLPQQALDALSGKADSFAGKVYGRDRLSKTEQAAVSAVLARAGYGENTGCLINSARYDGKTQNTFLLFFDLEVLSARGKMRGDLWFDQKDGPVRILEEVELSGVKLLKSGAVQAFLAQGEKDGGENAFLYTVTDGSCVQRFKGASSVTEAGKELCVTYPSECFRYDPLIREWDGAGGGVPYFYTMREDGPQPEEVREITAEEYLNLTAQEDSQAQWKAQQEEMLLAGERDGQLRRYTFFKIGDNRAGYRECGIGRPASGEDEIDHAVAEYRYTVYEMTDGRLRKDALSYSGDGFYFFNREDQEEELQALDELPLAFKKNRLDRYSGLLKTAGRRALSAVRSQKEYSQEDLGFVHTADFGGPAGEAFVLAGRYDGVFGAPVCDLWYVSGATARLMQENLLLKEADIYSCAGTRLLLVEVYGASGEKEYLYGASDEGPRRLLETAERIDIRENGDIRAWLPEGEYVLPYDFYMADGKETLYPAVKMDIKDLKPEKNGEAVYERLLALAGGREERLSCLYRENQVIHVMIAPSEENSAPASYENYELRDGYLILRESGKGAYRADGDAAAQPGDEE